MKPIYLIWERESYCDYDVVAVSFDKEKLINIVLQKNAECGYERFSLEEKEFDEFKEIGEGKF